MKIIISSNYDQNAACKSSDLVNSELTHLFQETVSNYTADNDIHWIKNNEVVMKKESPLKLHNFLLKAEQLGKRIKYNKQTIIEIEE